MIYYFLKFILNIFYRVFYRLHYRNMDNIPAGKAVILAPNHTNAFIDPTISCMLLPIKVRFFARGDVFKGKMARYFLDKMNISPMYRMQEGFGEVKKNDKTFEECKQLLSENKAILLFPEGICVQERRLRKLRKGLARILFMTEEAFDFKKEVLVVPIGINYNKADKIRSKVFIDFGKPISAKDYFERFKTDKARAINEFTQVVEDRMRETMLVIEDPQNDKLVEGLEEMLLEPWMQAKGADKHDLEKDHETSVEIAELVNKLAKKDEARLASLRNEVQQYIKELHAHKLRDHLLRPESIERMSTLSFLRDFLIIWFGVPLYWIGMFMNYPPYFLSQRYADKKVKNIEFHASVNANLAWILWLPWYAIQLVAVGLVFRSWPVLGAYALLVPLLLYYCLNYFPLMKKILGRWRLMRLVRKERDKVERLIFKRQEIVDEVEGIKRSLGH